MNGKEFKVFRANNGLTQKGLADIAGMPYQTIQKIESGVKPLANLQLFTAVKLAKALGVPAEDFVK